MNLDEDNSLQADLATKLHYEKACALARLGPSSIPVSLLNGVLVVAVMRNTVTDVVLWSWLIFLVTLTIMRAILLARFWRLDEGSREIRTWSAVYLASIYASAACWGILPLWETVFTTSWSESFIVFMVAGMSAGGMISLYPFLQAAIPYLMIALGPLIFVLASGEEQAHLAMALFASLYLMLLVRSAFSLQASTQKSIRLELENEELFKFLLAAKNSRDNSLPDNLRKTEDKLIAKQPQ